MKQKCLLLGNTQSQISNNIHAKVYICQVTLKLELLIFIFNLPYGLPASTFRSPAVPSINALANASGSLRPCCFLIRACAFFVAHTCQSFACRDELQERQAVTRFVVS